MERSRGGQLFVELVDPEDVADILFLKIIGCVLQRAARIEVYDVPWACSKRTGSPCR